MSRRLAGAALTLCVVAGCAVSSQSIEAQSYERTIARYLGHYVGSKEPQFIEITEPKTVLDGSTVVCVKVHLRDGRGGFHPASDASYFVLQGETVAQVQRNQPNCEMIGTFHRLQPIPPGS